MRDISTEFMRVLALLLITGLAAFGQEGEGDERGGDEAQPRSLGLLQEMADRAAWMSMGEHPFEVRQFSSRRLAPDEEAPEGAFVSKDGRVFPQGKRRFGNRDEYVLAAGEGPGVITRIWLERPMGQLRLRVDGEEIPALDVECEAALAGYITILSKPFSMKSGSGGVLRRPMPFAKSFLLTCDAPDGDFLIDSRRYLDEPEFLSFDTTTAINEGFPFAGLIAQMRADYEPLPEDEPKKVDEARVIPRPDAVARPKPGETVSLLSIEDAEKPSQLASFEIETLAPFLPSPLEDLYLLVDCDGERCLEAPLEQLFDFDGFRDDLHSPSIRTWEAIPRRLRRRRFSLPQPFEKSLRIRIENRGEATPPSLRFRFEKKPADPRMIGRRLRARVLDLENPVAQFDEPALIVSEILSSAPFTRENHRVAVQHPGTSPAGIPLELYFGSGRAAHALMHCRLRGLDRLPLGAGAPYRLKGLGPGFDELPSDRILLLAYTGGVEEKKK